MDGPRLSPVFLKHKFLSGVEEIMKLEENVENQNPLTWKSLLTFFFFFFLVNCCGKQRQMGEHIAGRGLHNCPHRGTWTNARKITGSKIT